MISPAIYLVLLIPVGVILAAVIFFKGRKARGGSGRRVPALNLRMGEVTHAGSPAAPSARRYAEVNPVITDLEAGLSPTGTDSTQTSGVEVMGSISSVSKVLPDMMEHLRSHTSPESSTDLECAICLEGYATMSDEFPKAWVARLRCGHMYHHDCIAAWLKKDGSCPLCRHSVGVRRPAAARPWSFV